MPFVSGAPATLAAQLEMSTPLQDTLTGTGRFLLTLGIALFLSYLTFTIGALLVATVATRARRLARRSAGRHVGRPGVPATSPGHARDREESIAGGAR